jgi:arylsulfatase A-like enzyme
LAWLLGAARLTDFRVPPAITRSLAYAARFVEPEGDSMTMRSRRSLPTRTLACWAAALAACLAWTPSAAAPAKPNILFIVGDDMGYADVGFHGCKDIPTPNLDALAASGVRCTSGYVSGPYCSPTRAGLLTGRYQTRFGHEFNPSGTDAGLPLGEKTIADRLRASGYATGLVGKWHLGSGAEYQPQRRGFDEFFGFLGGSHSYFEPPGMLRGTNRVAELDYTTDAFGREAAAFIERHKGRPWFLYLAFNAVHTPMHATDARLARFAQIPEPKRRTYCAMMVAMDEAIGRVLQQLRRADLAEQTLVCFIADNGGPVMPGTTMNAARNAPLRGGKRTTLEGGVRVPFIVSWPGRLQPAVYPQPVIQLDLAATALAVAGFRPEAGALLDGVNLLPFLQGETTGAPHEALYWRFGTQMAIRAGDFKLVRYDSNAETLTGVRNQPVSPARLYNLTADAGETKDLASALPQQVKELQARWDAWNAGNTKPAWGSQHTDNNGAEPSGALPAKGNKPKARGKSN